MQRKSKLIISSIIGILITILSIRQLIVTICTYPLEGELKYGIIPICLLYLAILLIIFDYLKKVILYAIQPNENKEILLENIVVKKLFRINRMSYEYNEENKQRFKFGPKKRIYYKLTGSYCDSKDGTYHKFSQIIYDLIDIELEKYIKENNITAIPLMLTTTTLFLGERVEVRKLKEDCLKYATSSMSDKQILKKVFDNYSPKMIREFFIMLIGGILGYTLGIGTYNWKNFLTAWLIIVALIELVYIIVIYMQYKRIKKIHTEIL